MADGGGQRTDPQITQITQIKGKTEDRCQKGKSKGQRAEGNLKRED